MVFGLVRGAGAFATVLPSFSLVSRMPFAQHNHGFDHFFSATFSSRRETMVVGVLVRASAFRVDLGVSGLPSCLDRAFAHHTCGFLAC